MSRYLEQCPEDDEREEILRHIEETYEDMYYMPVESALIPDWFERYWELSEKIFKYFKLPFRKHRITSPDEGK